MASHPARSQPIPIQSRSRSSDEHDLSALMILGTPPSPETGNELMRPLPAIVEQTSASEMDDHDPPVDSDVMIAGPSAVTSEQVVRRRRTSSKKVSRKKWR